MDKRTIVILYGKEKHEIVANGIKQHIANLSKNYDVVIIDDESFTPNYSAKTKRRFYTFCQRNASWLYRFYSIHEERKHVRLFKKQRKQIEIKRSNSKRDKLKRKVALVKNIILRFDPIAVICMTPNSLESALSVRELYGFDLYIFSFMADFGMDLRFLDTRCDKYLVANDSVRKKILRYGIGEDKIVVTGVPYTPSIKEKLDKEKCKSDLDIDNNDPIVVLSGGKYGAFRIIEDYNKIVDSACQFNLIAITGGNKKLNALMHAINIGEKNKKIIILDNYDYNKLLTVADVFITIPTTDNLLNGLIYDCVTVAIKPISMIEKSNFHYINKTGIAIASKNAYSTVTAVTRFLLEDAEKAAQLDRAGEYIKSKNREDDKIYELLEVVKID